MNDPENVSKLSLATLTSIDEKHKKAIEITQSKIDIKRREGKLIRDEKLLDTFGKCKTVIAWMCIVSLAIFFMLVFIAGIGLSYPSGGKGWIALETLFIEVTNNAKSILLIVLGFFFRGYLPSYKDKDE